MSPNSAQLQRARQLLAEGRADAARDALMRLVRAGARGPAVDDALAEALLRLGEYEQAAYFARRAAAGAPGDAGACERLLVALLLGGARDEAISMLAGPPGAGPVAGAWGWAAQQAIERDRPVEAAAVCEAALRAHPDDPMLWQLLYNALAIVGDSDGAYRCLADATARHPSDGALATALCQTATAASAPTARQVADAHRAFGSLLERVRPDGPALPRAPVDPDRPLTVGILTYEFRFGAASFFLRPALEGLAADGFRVLVYHTESGADATTAGLARLVAGLRHIPGASPDDIAARIRADGVDVLLELNGHTGDRNLVALQPRCAPVQVSYLGYANTTGMRSVDFRIVDSITDPPGASESLASERLVRIDPCFLCYRPFERAPDPAPPPCAGPGDRAVMFGSFNDTMKLNDGVFRLWARVLTAVPGSRLVLKGRLIGRPGVNDRIIAAMGSHGIERSRLELLGYSMAFEDHLAAYSRIDIALDTFPYNGTTTTCEALHMGVPVIVLTPGPEHDRHAARVGMSLLRAARVPEWIAADADGYVELAARLASDRSELAAVRAGLRQRVLGSALCDAGAFGRRFAGALRWMWQDRCREASGAG